MRLSSMADYAVVTMSAAARHCGYARVSAQQLADETGLPLPTVQKLVSRLSAAGLIESARGTGGSNPSANTDVPASWSPNRTRPLCPYPLIAKYDGAGDVNSEESFTCEAAAVDARRGRRDGAGALARQRHAQGEALGVEGGHGDPRLLEGPARVGAENRRDPERAAIRQPGVVDTDTNVGGELAERGGEVRLGRLELVEKDLVATRQ